MAGLDVAVHDSGFVQGMGEAGPPPGGSTRRRGARSFRPYGDCLPPRSDGARPAPRTAGSARPRQSAARCDALPRRRWRAKNARYPGRPAGAWATLPQRLADRRQFWPRAQELERYWYVQVSTRAGPQGRAVRGQPFAGACPPRHDRTRGGLWSIMCGCFPFVFNGGTYSHVTLRNLEVLAAERGDPAGAANWRTLLN